MVEQYHQKSERKKPADFFLFFGKQNDEIVSDRGLLLSGNGKILPTNLLVNCNPTCGIVEASTNFREPSSFLLFEKQSKQRWIRSKFCVGVLQTNYLVFLHFEHFLKKLSITSQLEKKLCTLVFN